VTTRTFRSDPTNGTWRERASAVVAALLLTALVVAVLL